MNFVLGIQTVEFPNDVVLIKADGTIVEKVEIKTKERTVELLKKKAESILNKKNLKIRDIDLVTVCLGPGSYTGTRGGLAFAKGLCQLTGISLVGVTAFEVLERNIKNIENKKDRVFLLDAKNQRVFYKWKGKEQIEADKIDDVIDEVEGATLFVGSGAVLNRGTITSELKNKAHFVEGKLNSVCSEQVAREGLAKYKKDPSIYSKDYLYKILPLYILPASITQSGNYK